MRNSPEGWSPQPLNARIMLCATTRRTCEFHIREVTCADTGVCTDEVIRSYRAVGVDLQKEVHEDMARDFGAYPKKWRWFLGHPDANIDHRRVPNLMVFFGRKGESLPIGVQAADYFPGDLVTWDLGGGVPHVGVVVDQKDRWSGRYMIVHNIGQGPKMEDVLFNWKITGHYRYFGPQG